MRFIANRYRMLRTEINEPELRDMVQPAKEDRD